MKWRNRGFLKKDEKKQMMRMVDAIHGTSYSLSIQIMRNLLIVLEKTKWEDVPGLDDVKKEYLQRMKKEEK